MALNMFFGAARPFPWRCADQQDSRWSQAKKTPQSSVWKAAKLSPNIAYN
jgi:hypothetical protein